MPYSHGVAPYYDLFSRPDDPADAAAGFVLTGADKPNRVLDIGAGTGTTALALIAYARATLRPGGWVVLDFPVASPRRQPRPRAVVSTQVLGRLRIEHSSAMEHNGARWKTHWRFVSHLDDRVVNEVTRTFDWAPLTHEGTDGLVRRGGLQVVSSFAGCDRGPYVQGESTTRLVVAKAA